MRRAALLLKVAAFVVFCFPVVAQDMQPNILSAHFDDPTDRYDHGILGDAIEYGALVLNLDMCPQCALLRRKTVKITLPKSRVFEDLIPRLADLDGDGLNEAIVVETSLTKGASLAIYGPKGRIAATPFLGRAHRWLAPIGAADLDGDGRMEFAYVEKPHLTMILRIWRLEDGKLQQVANRQGLTNHRIGDDFITGGIRDCAGLPEMITVDPAWSSIMASTLVDGMIVSKRIADFTGPASMKTALEC